MKYMYEICCAANNKRTDVDFTESCFNHWLLTEKEIPEATGNHCDYCNGGIWSIKITNISEKDMFRKRLYGNWLTLGYQVSEECKMYKVPQSSP